MNTKTRSGINSVTAEAANGESEPNVFFRKEVSSTSVESHGGKCESFPSSNLL